MPLIGWGIRSNHAPFQMMTVVQDQICFQKFSHVAGGRLVEVGVDAGTHQGGDLCMRTDKAAQWTGDHLGGAEDALRNDPFHRLRLSGGIAAGDDEKKQQETGQERFHSPILAPPSSDGNGILSMCKTGFSQG